MLTYSLASIRINRHRKDKTVPYKGADYIFEIGKPVEFPNGVLSFLLISCQMY